MSMLPLLLFLFPLLSSLIFLIPSRSVRFYHHAGLSLLILFLISTVFLCVHFNLFTQESALVVFEGLLPGIYSELSLKLGGPNCLFIFLSILGPWCIFLFSKFESRFFYFLIFLFLFFLNAAFMGQNLFSFYIFSESAMIVMLILANFFGPAGLIGKREMRNLIVVLGSTSTLFFLSLFLAPKSASLSDEFRYFILFFCILTRLGPFPFSFVIKKLMSDPFSLFGILWSFLMASASLYALWRFILPEIALEIASYSFYFITWILVASFVAVISFFRERGVKDQWHHFFFLAINFVLLGLFLPSEELKYYALYSWFAFLLMFLLLYMFLQGGLTSKHYQRTLVWPVMALILLNEAILPFTANFVGQYKIILELFSYHAILGGFFLLVILLLFIKLLSTVYELSHLQNLNEQKLAPLELVTIYFVSLLLILMGLLPDPIFTLIKMTVS